MGSMDRESCHFTKERGLFFLANHRSQDRREAMLFMPDYLEDHLIRVGVVFPSNPYVRFRTTVRFSQGKRAMTVVGMRLDKWLKAVSSDTIKALAHEI